MLDTVLYALLSLVFLFVALNFYRSKNNRRNLPPSPPGFPFLGHLHLQKPPMHRTLQSLAQIYGPIFSLRFGRRLVVIVSSSSAVEECFNKNDIVLANRPEVLMAKHVSYNQSTMTQAPYGEHWRNLRRIATTEVFANHRLNMLVSVRKDEVKRLITNISRSSQSLHDFSKVVMKSMFEELTFNIMMRTVTGKRYFGKDVTNEEEATQCARLMKELASLYGTSNRADFFPLWNLIDGGRFMRRVIQLAKKTDAFLQGLVDETRSKMSSDSLKTVAYNLLCLQQSQPDYYNDVVIKGFILVILLAGSDTTSVTLEWAMANLLNNPDKLKKARDELDREVGQDRLVDEPDLPKLRYLQNIITETLRMYPAAPLLDPHMASEDCVIGGYDVPKGTIVLANAFALQRDPTLWEDPDTFIPERFETERGSLAHKLIPFGLGRRSCPGISLANRVLGLALGSMIQCYDWKRATDEKLDMTEGVGITTPMVVPLEAMCRPRSLLAKVLDMID
ncbi:hypothetical protein K2173_002533 [Erythroxylum novogranatense]|uniref:Oxidase n=1 Tax=Erythroxylum novogranatense TaxID=1862640 RepID=A0A9E8M4C5_9ROSI|nr:hypothetical protein K2173_002533 [Erythroxylum novogranatense]WAA27646.1 oxidase [Erythroxylum novogranatense]